MLRNLAFALALTTALSGCAGNPFDGMAWPRAEDGVEGKPESAKVAALLRVADATALAGDYGSALSMYRRALEADPQNADVLLRLGDILLRVGENTEAADVFRKAISFRRSAEPFEGLAKALIALDQPEAAVSHLNAALEIDERASTYNVIGVAKDLLGDHGAAQAYYRTGLDLAPSDMSLRNNLGLSLAVSGRHGEAMKILRDAAASAGATARNRLNLALAYGLAGETGAAAETARLDLDEASVQQNLSFYETLRALDDSRLTIRAIGAHNAALGKRLGPSADRQTSHR